MDFPFMYRFKPGYRPQGSGLATARRAQQAANVACIKVQVKILYDPLTLIAAGKITQI